ncbi:MULTISPECIES: MauE/DoxX family redox-associated membrane protein [unclassified Corynebacterium]|uniref:DoxX family protein n=1 Tax=unclassified Corynebacterium TaxID=2624378 RepID=UPI0035246FD1
MRRFLIVLFSFAGLMHFLRPDGFDRLVPEQLPGAQRAWTYGSGYLELATALLLAIPGTRRIGGLVTTFLMLGVWPGNMKMAWDFRRKSPWLRSIAFLRLPLQIPLIRAGLRIWREQ